MVGNKSSQKKDAAVSYSNFQQKCAQDKHPGQTSGHLKLFGHVAPQWALLPGVGLPQKTGLSFTLFKK